MTEILLIGGVIGSCVVVLCMAIVSVRFQRYSIKHLQVQQHAWEQAQEIHRKHWEELQEKYQVLLEKTLLAQVEQAKQLALKESTLEKETKSHSQRITRALLELPRIEDTPLPSRFPAAGTGGRPNTEPVTDAYPAAQSFQGANLIGHDLSFRYLRHADLRDADLSQANLFMADLTGACLRGAKLVGADLLATNCNDADLTGADLTGANMLVTDLNDTLLVDATLLNVRNLTGDQLRSAIIDHTTRIDTTIDITLPRIPSVSRM